MQDQGQIDSAHQTEQAESGQSPAAASALFDTEMKIQEANDKVLVPNEHMMVMPERLLKDCSSVSQAIWGNFVPDHEGKNVQ